MKHRTRSTILSIGTPYRVCAHHLSEGYQARSTIDALARHVSIQPTGPGFKCAIRTHAGACPLPAVWRLTYWQVKESKSVYVPETTQKETLFDA